MLYCGCGCAGEVQQEVSCCFVAVVCAGEQSKSVAGSVKLCEIQEEVSCCFVAVVVQVNSESKSVAGSVKLLLCEIQQKVSCCIVAVVVQVNSEEPVYHAVLDWVKHDEKNRLIWLSSLLQFVRLPLLSACFITDVIDTEVEACIFSLLGCQ